MRVLLGLLFLSACSSPPEELPGFSFDLPPGFPTPRVPEDNPMSEAKVQLGRTLFYDPRLSLNETQSCSTCHIQSLAFTDGRTQAIGSTGETHRRNTQSLVNVAYAPGLTWANPFLGTLEAQAIVPFINQDPIELGFAGQESELLQRLRNDPEYPALFAEAFPEFDPVISMATITRALSSFQRVLLSGNSPYDRFVNQGDVSALSEAQQRGMTLFFSERTECNHCHIGFNLTDAAIHAGTTNPSLPFHNTGLYDLDGLGAYPNGDTGLFELTNAANDMGKFRAPSLRNIAVTAPYMHDGSIATLDEVLDHYSAGGLARALNGAPSPLQSSFVRPFSLTPEERADLLEFFQSLTDEEFLTDPRFSAP